VTHIRLVVASPGDVGPEREAVEKVAAELNRLLGRSDNFVIDVYRWETDSGPGFHPRGAQGKIDEDLPIADCGIMVGIFWMRFGTPILAGTETRTEHEINLAFEAWKKTSKKPQILIYFKKAAPDRDRIEPDQIARVKNFKREFDPFGRYEQGKYEEFVTLDDFKDKVRTHIAGHLPKRLRGLARPPGAFDFGSYRTKFGYESRWDLSNIGVAQTAGKMRSLVGYLKVTLEEMDCNTTGLAEALKDENGPRPILLVDGWDELGSIGREFRQKLAGFVRAHPRVGVVATSRPYGLEKPDAHDGFNTRFVQPLNDEEIAAFSSRFWSICYGKDPKHGELAQRFLAALESASSAKDLARTPLLCTMMLFISRSRTLPDERHDLYLACIEHMLSAYRREEAQVPGMNHHYWRPEKMNERLRAAAALAFAVHQQEDRTPGRAIVMPVNKMAQLLPQGCKEQSSGSPGK
jgi:hypothetical protein